MGNIVIRKAVCDDAREIIAYLHQVSGESEYLLMGAGEFAMTEEQERIFIRECHSADNSLFLVAEHNNQIVSVLTFIGGKRSRNRHTGETGITVAKQFWGTGIGTKMMQYLVEWAKAGRVIRKINLRVRADNSRAINLYNKMGFVAEGRVSREFFINNQFYDSLCMGLEID